MIGFLRDGKKRSRTLISLRVDQNSWPTASSEQLRWFVSNLVMHSNRSPQHSTDKTEPPATFFKLFECIMRYDQ